jgi:hypothetical protein
MRFNIFYWLRIKVWDRLWNTAVRWLNYEREDIELPPNDFKQLCYEIRPGDVILVEGRSRVSEVIKLITQSPWTHSALYIGHVYELKDHELRQQVEHYYDGHPDSPLIIEALLGEGTVVHTLYKYRHDHVRICRPTGIRPYDARKVIKFAIKKLGSEYHVRQLLDLARFMFPYSFLPRRWRSTLFMHNVGTPTQTVCSTMLSEAFQAIKFPILPVRRKMANGQIRLYMRNPKLVTPKDFDYSPYFEIIKYPVFGFDKAASYQKMPWNKEGIVCHEPGNCYLPDTPLEAILDHDNILHHKINLLRSDKHKRAIGKHKKAFDTDSKEAADDTKTGEKEIMVSW